MVTWEDSDSELDIEYANLCLMVDIEDGGNL